MLIPKLRYWRERRALTQEELAEKADVGARSIAGYEAGAGVRPGNVRKLAEALDINVSALMVEEETPKKAAAPPSFEWATAAPDKEFDGWVKKANLHDTLTLNYVLSEAAARESVGSDKHSFLLRRINIVIARFRDIGGPFTETKSSVRKRARQAQRNDEDVASGAG